MMMMTMTMIWRGLDVICYVQVLELALNYLFQVLQLTWSVVLQTEDVVKPAR